MHVTVPKSTSFEQVCWGIVNDELHRLSDDFLLEDVDLLCQYVVVRFLKTSPHVHGRTVTKDLTSKLLGFVEEIYPVMVTFITMANSLPVRELENETN